MTWNRLDQPGATPGDDHPPAPGGRPRASRRRYGTIALIVIAAVVIAGHLVLAGAIVVPQWTNWTAAAVLAVVLVKITLIALGYRTHRRRKAAKPADPRHFAESPSGRVAC